MRVVLDIDGVFASFTKAYGELLTKVGGSKLPKGWQDDPDFPSVWDWDSKAGYSTDIQTKVWERYILQESSEFWKSLEPLPTARETLMYLSSLAKKGKVECYFLTNRMGYRVKAQTEEWLYGNGFDYPTVIIAADKTPWLRLLKANFFIDDRLDTVKEVARVSTEEKWPDFQCFLKYAPYNRELWGKVKGAATVKDALVAGGFWNE